MGLNSGYYGIITMDYYVLPGLDKTFTVCEPENPPFYSVNQLCRLGHGFNSKLFVDQAGYLLDFVADPLIG